MPLQVGEVWQEISRELSLEGVKPITPDQEALSTIIQIMEDTARRVTSEQKTIMEQHEKEELSQEENMYTEVLAVRFLFIIFLFVKKNVNHCFIINKEIKTKFVCYRLRLDGSSKS